MNPASQVEAGPSSGLERKMVNNVCLIQLLEAAESNSLAVILQSGAIKQRQEI